VSKYSLITALESVARSRFGRITERILRKLGLFPVVQRPYSWTMSRLTLHKGEYPIAVENADAAIIVRNVNEFNRVKSMYEEDVLSRLLRDLDSDDVFYDIGANVGIYSCLVGDILPDGSVVAVEPHPENVSRLRENLSHNGVEATVLRQALSNRTGEVSLAVAVESHTTSPGHNLIEVTDTVKEYGEEGVKRIETEMSRGDNLTDKRGLPSPTVLKIDVEGGELDVLRGFEQTLRSDCRLVYCEVHRTHISKFDGSDAELRDFLKSCGFTIEPLNDHGSKYHLRAIKR